MPSSVVAAVPLVVTVAVVLVPALVLAVVVVVLVLPALAHPLLANEIDRLAARVVLAAVALPVVLMLLRNVEVHRLLLDDDARRRDDHRLRMPQCRRRHVA